MIKKMKSLDVLTIVCGVFLVALVLLGSATTPSYLFVVELVLLAIIIVTVVLNLRYKNEMSNSTIEIVKAVSTENYDDITESLIESFGLDIADGIESIIQELQSKNHDMKYVIELAKHIEKDELNKFKLRDIEIEPQLKHALRVFMKQKEITDSSQKINTEFLKKIKSHKFTKIDIDNDNVTEQQLNAILKSFEIIDSNIKNTQPAFYEGDFNVEIEKTDIEKDYLNITSRLGTLLTSQKKSIINLYYAILMLEEFDHQEIISQSYKGNLVHNFRALETVYENLTVSIENIAYAIEHKVNINYDNVSEIFKPIIDVINNDEVFTNSLPETVNVEVEETENTAETKDDFDKKLLNSKSNFEERHFTQNHELILDIENRLKNMKIVFDEDDDLYLEVSEDEVEKEEVIEEVIEEVLEKVVEEVAEEIVEKDINTDDDTELVSEDVETEIQNDDKSVDNTEIHENIEISDITEDSDLTETTETISDTEFDIEVENVENVEEVEEVEEIKALEDTEEVSNEDLADVETVDNSDLDEQIDNVTADNELNDLENVSNNKDEKVQNQTIRSFNKNKAETRTNNNDIKKAKTKNKELVRFNNNKRTNNSTNTTRLEKNTYNSSARTNTQDKLKNTSNKLKENKGGKRVNSITGDRNNQKKPLTYQEAIKSGEFDKIKNESNSYRNDNSTVKKITPINGRSVKAPVTYQQFLKDKDGAQRTTDGSANTVNSANNTKNAQRRPVESKPKASRYAAKETPLRDGDSAKKRSKLVENLGRELSQRERAELDLYGEILDDKTRAKMDVITSGTDLAGF